MSFLVQGAASTCIRANTLSGKPLLHLVLSLAVVRCEVQAHSTTGGRQADKGVAFVRDDRVFESFHR